MPEFPVTLATLVTRIRRLLEDSPEVDTITVSIDASTTTLSVASPHLYGKGAVIEIDDEQMMTSEEVSGHTATVRRGYRGTTAASHSNGAIVRINPRFGQANIKEAINVVLGNWISFYAPQLVWDSSTAGTFNPNRDIYPVAADATSVRTVAYKESGAFDLRDLDIGRLETYPTSIASTGKGVRVAGGPSGYAAHVLYERPWQPLESDAATVPSDFPPMMDSLIVEGAVLYLMGWRMVPKFRLDESVFAREQSDQVPSTFNVQSLALMQRTWIANMHRMAGMRPSPTKPRKVWR